MSCEDVLNAVEPIAAGELKPDDRLAAHLSTCASCASALEGARRLDALLRERTVAPPPTHFTSRTMARIRRERWRNEQMIDWSFNVILTLVAVALAVGIWIVVSRSGVTIVSNDAVQLAGTSMRTFFQRVSPSLPVYALATALILTALGVWWWAERDAPI